MPDSTLRRSNRHPLSWAVGLSLSLGAALFVPGVSAANRPATDPAPKPSTSSPAQVEARYQAERHDCLSGRTGQARDTCLQEAAAARELALRGALDNGESLRERRLNATARCQVHPPAERASCELLALGQGTSSGSVREGGVIREIVTRTEGPPATE